MLHLRDAISTFEDSVQKVLTGVYTDVVRYLATVDPIGAANPALHCEIAQTIAHWAKTGRWDAEELARRAEERGLEFMRSNKVRAR